MNSLHHLAQRDLEALSAYLDGELRPAEAKRLAERLGREPNLQQALAELRAIRQNLRALPEVQPPRPLTLTPAMVGARATRRPYPALRLATALATVAFLVVSGANAVVSRGFRLGTGEPAAAPMMLEAAAPAADATEAVDPSTTPEMLQRAAAPETAVLGEKTAETPTAPTPPGEVPLAAEPPPSVAAGSEAAESGVEQTSAIPLRALRWLQVGLGALVVMLALLTLRVRRRSG